MKTDLIQIGNSRGIRIPKSLIEQCGLGDTVDVRIEGDCLVISPQRRMRQGWEESFRAAGPAIGDELPLEEVAQNEFDRKEWQW